MIEYIKKEPIIKRMLIVLTGVVFLTSVLIFLIHLFMIQKIYVERENLNKQLVGSLVKLNPQNEIEIVKTVVKKGSSENLKYGENILKKYGYNDSVKAWDDESFDENVHNIALYDIAAFVIMFITIGILFSYYMLFFIKRVEKISAAVDNIMNSNFLLDIEMCEEGILSRLNTQFYQMARWVEMTMNKLEKEKEGVKSLVTDISHQIKTPLSSIKLFNSLLLEDDNINKKEKTEFLNTIKDEVAKLEWLTGSLIKLSMLEVHMIKLKKENKPLRATIIKAVEGVYSKSLQKNIEISVEADDEFIAYHDVKWTKEAILNVLENAIKYTKYDGKINVKIISMNSYIKIDIEDNGIGISEEDFNNIFKRFFRGKSKEVQEVEGSGVGLYLTRKILEEQGGSIILDSVIGTGTKFSLFLQKCK